jgi:hypothetical protein
MNTSANTNHIHDAPKVPVRTTPTGFRRRTMAGALLVMALTASAVGFAAMSHADDDTQIPGTDPAISVLAPAPPPPLTPWLDGLLNWALHPHMHCGYRGFEGKFRCDYY